VNQREQWNRRIIDEFRANQGVVGGAFEGIPILLLHHEGARSGTPRVSPLAYRRDGDRHVVFASNGGRPINPAWYHNVQAHPRVTIEVGTEKLDAEARVATGDERERLWSLQTQENPAFADYETKAKDRTIPVVILEPVSAT
jgi:deazaflavin-dependent oxidoreductase (nitroreductase family)